MCPSITEHNSLMHIEMLIHSMPVFEELDSVYDPPALLDTLDSIQERTPEE